MHEKEKRLIKVFLTEYKKLHEEQTGLPFNPRSLTIMNQPDMTDINSLDWVSYNKWFDELDIGVYQGGDSNIVQAFLEVPINILISAEEAKKPLLSNKDQKKLAKALKLIAELKIGASNEKD